MQIIVQFIVSFSSKSMTFLFSVAVTKKKFIPFNFWWPADIVAGRISLLYVYTL